MIGRVMMLVTAVGSVIFLSGCGEINLPDVDTAASADNGGEHFIYRGHDFGPNRDANYRKGIMDGCTTAGGTYAKDHILFKSDTSYRTGWESGELQCGKQTTKK